MSIIAIIPARFESKRIPHKNIKHFLGIPIIEYSINACVESKIFSKIIVSTDSETIKDIATKAGAQVPFLRSPKNSDDHATTADVIDEVLSNLKKNGETYEICCCIYPTALFVSSDILSIALEKLIDSQSDAIIPICQFSYPPQRSLRIDGLQLFMNNPKLISTRSQDLETYYHDAGQFYLFKVKSFNKDKEIFTQNTTFIIIPESEVQDIDSLEDWKIAELKYELLQKKLESE